MNTPEFVEWMHTIIEQGEPVPVNKGDIATVLRYLPGGLAGIMSLGGSIKLTRFGEFEMVWRNERNGRNARTGEQLRVPGRWVVRFKQSRRMLSNN